MNFANVKALAIPEGNVKQIADGQGVVLWKAITGPDYTEPFYVKNITNTDEVLSIGKVNSNAPTITVEYSIDKINWSTLGSTGTIALTYTLHPGDKLYLRASTYQWSSGSNNYNRILGVSMVGGNIMSLLYGSNFTGEETTFPNRFYTYTFAYLFNGGVDNNILQDVSKLLLPVKENLPEQCYYGMFIRCTAITETPELPATKLNTGVYNGMFQKCTSLITACELPATVLGNQCYSGMFLGCSSLRNVPSILPATSLYSNCYAQMFKDCTSLVTAPELPAKTLAVQSYNAMFRGCGSLNYIKCLATNVSANNCTYNWVDGVNASGIFIKDTNMSGWSSGASGIPSGWTVQNM